MNNENYPEWFDNQNSNYLRNQVTPQWGATTGASHGLGGSRNPSFGSFTKGGGLDDLGEIGSSIFDLSGDNPYDTLASGEESIRPTLEDYLKRSTSYLDPYQKAGISSMGDYLNMLKQGEDPSKLIGGIEAGYQESPGAKFQEKRGLADISTGSAARGLLGSGTQAREMMKYGTNLASQNMNQYLNQALGVRGRTLQGLGGMTELGQRTGTQLGDWTYGTGQNIANLQSQIAEAKAASAQQSQSDWGDIFGDVASVASLL